MASELPSTMVVRVIEGLTSQRNAVYLPQSDKGAGLVGCTGDTVWEALAKIDVESSINPRYVHLKFAHSNKYWGRAGPGPNDYWIRATTDQPEEDTSKASCTLFEPSVPGPGLVSFTHVQSRAAVQLDTSSRNRGLYATTGTPTTFGFINGDTLFELPRRVLFKGDNGSYLKAYTHNGYPHLQFGSQDPADQYVVHQIEMQPTGHIRLKNEYYDKFCRCNADSWILANSGTSANNPENLYLPVLLEAGVIALRSMRNNQYCKRVSNQNLLSASASTTDQYTRLQVEEPVSRRQIRDVRYRLEDARIFAEQLIAAGEAVATNPTDIPSSTTLSKSYTKTKTSFINNGYALRLGVSNEFSGGIPLVVQGKLTISAEVEVNLEWGLGWAESSTLTVSHTVVVPPKSEVTIYYHVTKGRCSVPFSYRQIDHSSTGGPPYHSTRTDGIYDAIDYYSLRFTQSETRPLAGTDLHLPST